jgi:acyl-CoA dehydrogenase
LIVVETDEAEGFERGRNLQKIGLEAADTSELFFNDVKVPTANLIGTEEGRGFYQLMEQLPQERLIIAVHSIAMIERALAVTIDYVKERKTFGRPIIDNQAVKFKLAECKTEATVARIFVNHCIEQHLQRKLDAATASMAKYWITDLQGKIIDVPAAPRRLRLYGRVSDRPHVQGRPRRSHLRRRQRDHEDTDRAHAVSVGRDRSGAMRRQ